MPLPGCTRRSWPGGGSPTPPCGTPSIRPAGGAGSGAGFRAPGPGTVFPRGAALALGTAGWLPRRRFRPPMVGPDTSVRHIAALLARTHTPLAAVVERDGDRTRLAGAVTAARLMELLVTGSAPRT
ncbi:hypothetical protein [Streptomyces sp. TRM68367]|uniref:hypothetical protein n=1 Tax=Streptomyces sp. TRM68367 TaxID=2758415 RepID=UPI001CA8D222|nr:hypothetical protein [Streptomyces sp. TRM68367]